MISGNNLEAVPCETLRAVFSIREAADALGTSPRVVRSLVAAGALEGLRLGTGHVRVTRISGASVRRFATGANG